MDDLRKIVWLASYPKSGNTWFRVFLTAIMNPSISKVDINSLYPTIIASSRYLFDEMIGISSADLSLKEIERLRPRVYRKNVIESTENIYHKIHDAWAFLPDGTPLFSPEITKAVLYFIRNPLDVAVSFAHHLSASIDKTIQIMNNPKYSFCYQNDRLHNQLSQNLHSWSGHVTSWVDDSDLPVMVLRYEDMASDPLKTFTRAITHLGLNFSTDEIQKAIESSSFELLKYQEIEKGFSEKSSQAISFFRKGIVGDWRNTLTSEQVKLIVNSHKDVMRKFGYI